MSPSPISGALRRLRRPVAARPAAPAAPDVEPAPVPPEQLRPEQLDPRVGKVRGEERPDVERVLPYTMTGVPRILALMDAVRYCVRRDIPGSFVECGVWRGGSVMAMILTLQRLGVQDRDIWLYDTFEGMTAPNEHDSSPFEPHALEQWEEAQKEDKRPWSYLFAPEMFHEESVRETLLSTGYPEGRLHFVRGPVEETLPRTLPGDIALLRLDTDWYESTRHELIHLYPLLAGNGVLIIDDYGHWEGARRAVDEYFAEHGPPLLLNRIDYSGRIAVKA